MGAAFRQWDEPASRERLVLMDLYDLTLTAPVKDGKPYPRPWPDPDKNRRGNTTLSREQVLAILAEHGHFRTD